MYILSGSDTMLAVHLLPLLRDRDQVCAFDRSMGDIGDGTFIDELLDEVKPKVFINCGGMESAEECEFDRERAYAVNALAVGALAERCRDRGVALLQASTSRVFDGRKGAPYSEDDITRPIQAYGDSKLLAETLIRDSGCDHLIIRFPDLFGGSGSFVHAIMDDIRSRGEVKVLKGHTISPTFAGDAARAILLLAEKGSRGTVHVANAGHVTMRDFIAELAGLVRRVLGNELPFSIVECGCDEYPAAADPPLFNVLDCARYALLAGGSLRGWREALAEYVARHHGEFA